MGQVVRRNTPGCCTMLTERRDDAREVFFADERVVPLDHEDSNYAAVNQHLFSKVPIPAENIHTIDVSLLDDPEACADEYEKQLVAAFVGKDSVAFPRFDLCLLGIGPESVHAPARVFLRPLSPY